MRTLCRRALIVFLCELMIFLPASDVAGRLAVKHAVLERIGLLGCCGRA